MPKKETKYLAILNFNTVPPIDNIPNPVLREIEASGENEEKEKANAMEKAYVKRRELEEHLRGQRVETCSVDILYVAKIIHKRK